MHVLWQAVLDVAGDNDGLVTREQIPQLGVTDRMIDRAGSDGLLCRVAPEVYRTRGAPQTERMAIATVSLGDGPDRTRRPLAISLTSRVCVQPPPRWLSAHSSR